MKNPTKIALAASLIGILGIAGVAKNVSASPSTIGVTVMPQHHNSTQVAEAAGGDGDGETNDDLIDKQEATRLQSLAKITSQQARKAAEADRRGKASSVKLENEDGNLVYSVAIGKDEVKVDAGNGKVLYTDNPKAETNEGKRPHSSIRISESPNGDGDGETNDDG
jgi:Peptidase propeptide and YPEB domain